MSDTDGTVSSTDARALRRAIRGLVGRYASHGERGGHDRERETLGGEFHRCWSKGALDPRVGPNGSTEPTLNRNDYRRSASCLEVHP